MDNRKFRDFEKLRVVTIYGITAMMILGVAHCAFLVFGLDILVIHILACLFGLVLGVVLSRLFGMCAIHRCMVYYIMAVLGCIVLRRYGVFGGYLFQARVLMMSVGIVLIACTVWKMICRRL